MRISSRQWGSAELEGLLTGLAEAVNLPYGGERTSVSAEEVRHGLTAILSVKMPDPKYSGATKDRLCNQEAYSAVREIAFKAMKKRFKREPQLHANILRHLGDISMTNDKMRDAGFR